MKLTKFIPLTKMEEQTDGSLRVFGTVTAEQPDLEKEVCDYAGTKPEYQQVSAEHLSKTSIPGMTPSLMPFREMHGLKVQGAGRSLVFDDAAKTIKMGFDVVDENAIKMWKAGCFIGFSQGGEYLKKWDDPDFPGCVRYIARPFEVSAVDMPCLPAALVESMKGRTVTLAKATGVTVEVPLQTNPVSSPVIDFLTSEKAVRGALASADRPLDARKAIMAAAAKLGIKLSDRDQKVCARACAKIALEKGLYEVGWLADMLESLHWLCLQTEFEREMEDDGSKVPDNLRAAWMLLIAEFKEMAIEEADELAAAGGKGETSMKITDQAGLTKAAKGIMDHLENLKAAHEKAGEAHAKTGEHIEKCMKACKDAMGGEMEEKAAPVPAVIPAVVPAVTKSAAEIATDEKIEALTKAFADLTAKLANTPAAGGPVSGVGATKTVDAPAELAALLN